MRDDTIRYIIHQLDSPGDIISVPRCFLRGFRMSAEAFAEYYKDLTRECNRVTAYEKLEDIHERLFGRPRYSDYDSFRVTFGKRRRGGCTSLT